MFTLTRWPTGTTTEYPTLNALLAAHEEIIETRQWIAAQLKSWGFAHVSHNMAYPLGVIRANKGGVDKGH